MNRQGKSLFFLILCFSPFFRSFSQDFENDSLKETRFIAKVKDITEFFERFNDEKNSAIRVYLKQQNISYKITRTLLLQSLFNSQKIHYNQTDVKQFIKKIIDPDNPKCIDFERGDWFAEVTCNFSYKNHPAKIPLILKTCYDSSTSSVKWVISSVTWAAHENEIISNATVEKNEHYFIPPSNQSTKFAKLLNVFNDKKHLTAYFDDDFFKGKSSLSFFSAVQNGELHFMSVRSIKYHFLQIKSWLFTVEEAENDSNNSGWLISSLKKMSDQEKLGYKRNLLYR